MNDRRQRSTEGWKIERSESEMEEGKMNGRREGWKPGLSVWSHCDCHGYRPMIFSVWPLLAERHVTGCGSISSIGSQLCRIKAPLRTS